MRPQLAQHDSFTDLKVTKECSNKGCSNDQPMDATPRSCDADRLQALRIAVRSIKSFQTPSFRSIASRGVYCSIFISKQRLIVT